MGLALTIGGGVDCSHDVVIELLNFELIHLWEALNDESADAVDVLLLKRIDVLNERCGGFTRCEERCHGVVNGEVRQFCSQNFVWEVDHGKRVVDEQVTSHKLVNEEFLDESEGRIVIKHTFLLPGQFAFLDFVVGIYFLALDRITEFRVNGVGGEKFSVTYRVIILIESSLLIRLWDLEDWRWGSSGLLLSLSSEDRKVSNSHVTNLAKVGNWFW